MPARKKRSAAQLGKHGKRQASSQDLDGAADDEMAEGALPARTPSPEWVRISVRVSLDAHLGRKIGMCCESVHRTNKCVVMHHMILILLLLRSNQPTSRDPFLVSLRTFMGRGERLRSYWNSHMSNASPRRGDAWIEVSFAFF